MDNLDGGCRIVSSQKKPLLHRLLSKQNVEDVDYLKFIPFKGFKDAPDKWTLAKSRSEQQNFNEFYGKLSSCYYTKAGNGDSAVEYQATLPEPGRYELYLSVPYGQSSQFYILPMFESGDLGETTVCIEADDGIHEETVDISKVKDEWAYVGTYSFCDTTAVIQITDKSHAKLVIADAIQLRKVE